MENKAIQDSRNHKAQSRMKQIQYRSYQREIEIYHFQAKYMLLRDFRRLLNRDKHGYIAVLDGPGKPLEANFVNDDDKPPKGCIEAAYLPNVFRQANRTGSSGSALGFRTGENIEWLCFDQPIKETILNKWIYKIVDPGEVSGCSDSKLFDLVAYMPKGLEERKVRGANEEHKQWHDSLLKAVHRPVKLKLTWKNCSKDLKDHCEAKQAARVKARMEKNEKVSSEATGRTNDEL